MPEKRYNAEEIIQKLRDADVVIAQGKNVQDACKHLGVSEQTDYRWRICKAPGISRNTVRYAPQPREDEEALTADILRFAGKYGRYGYRRAHALLRSQGLGGQPLPGDAHLAA